MNTAIKQDKYKPGDTFGEPMTEAAIRGELAEFLDDLTDLKYDISHARGKATGIAKTRLRFLGERVEKALQELRRVDTPQTPA